LAQNNKSTDKLQVTYVRLKTTKANSMSKEVMTSHASHKSFPAEITSETNNPDREEPTSYHSN
jgi:hypothetical protein